MHQLAFTLQANLPFVRHLEYESFLEENWYYEALNETYLPLMDMLDRLESDNIYANISLCTSTTLNAMMLDKALGNRFIKYLEKQIDLGNKEINRAKDNKIALKMATYYRDRAQRSLDLFVKIYKRDLLGKLAKLNNSGSIELICTAATSAHLPLYKDYPTMINAQVELAVRDFERNFGVKPKGFFLPNCGYFDGIEEVLDKYGIEYFHVAAQAFFLSSQRSKRGNYAPVITSNGTYAIARDYHLSSLIWSDKEGYPTDPMYREFYRDIGYDLPLSYISDFIQKDGSRVFTGYKYYSITGNTNEKELYDIDKARARVKEHAKNFIYEVEQKDRNLRNILDREALFSLSFNAELFGHWWFEGIWWLEDVIRMYHAKKQNCLTTCSNFIAKYQDQQLLKIAPSTWGNGGYNRVWLNRNNNWLYQQIHACIEHLQELAVRFDNQGKVKQRFLNQAARIVMLMTSSDWALILSNDRENSYANKMLKQYLDDFNLVYEHMCKNSIDTEWLITTEKRDVIFPEMDYTMFAI